MTPRRPRESSPLPIHPLLLPEERLRTECRIEFLRRSGPGGQHRNKTETAVRITHQPTGITGEASERRSQAENREVAWNRLRLNLALRIRGEIPTYPIVGGTDGIFEGFAPSSQQNIPTNRTDPTEIWSRHLVGDKIRVSPKNPDYPILILHFLNQWEKNGKDWEKTATGLRTTKSQLLRLIDATSSAAGTVRKMERESRKVPSPFVKVLIGLGGNLGEREKNIETA